MSIGLGQCVRPLQEPAPNSPLQGPSVKLALRPARRFRPPDAHSKPTKPHRAGAPWGLRPGHEVQGGGVEASHLIATVLS